MPDSQQEPGMLLWQETHHKRGKKGDNALETGARYIEFA